MVFILLHVDCIVTADILIPPKREETKADYAKHMTLTHRQQTPSLSIVVPVYNEQGTVKLFFDEVAPILNAITDNWEMIFINDGSDDNTLDEIKQYQQQDTRIKLIGLSRNFGKEIALSAGLFHTGKDVTIPMDVDLQDPPSLIPEMVKEWQKGYDVVLATRSNRKSDSFAKRITAGWFYKVIRKMSNINIPDNTGDFRLMDKKVVATINQCGERARFMKGLFAWAGYTTTQVFFERPERVGGAPKQNYRNLFRLAFDGIFSFSTVPLRVWTYVGGFIAALSFTYAIFIILYTMYTGIELPGYASTITLILFMGGIQLISLGVLGEYISRIYREVKQRPLFVIDEKLGFDTHNTHTKSEEAHETRS